MMMNNNMNSSASSSTALSSHPHSHIPTLCDVMAKDEEYKYHYHADRQMSFYRQGGYGGRDARQRRTTTAAGRRARMSSILEEEDSMDVMCAHGCWKFSAVAVIILVLVGYLMETQPLYIKGISTVRVQRTSSRRQLQQQQQQQQQLQLDPSSLFMANEDEEEKESSFWKTLDNIDDTTSGEEEESEEVQTIVSTSSIKFASLDWSSLLVFQPFHKFNNPNPYKDYQPKDEFDMDNSIHRNLEDEDVVDTTLQTSYDLIPQARVAFQTASFYFLFMVFSYIYAHNAVRIRHSVSSSSLTLVFFVGVILRRVKASFRSGAKQIRRQRRGYRDIPENQSRAGVGVGGGGGSSSMGMGMGGATIRVGYSSGEDRTITGGDLDHHVGGGGVKHHHHSRTIQMAPKVTKASATGGLKAKKAVPSIIGGGVGKTGVSEKSSVAESKSLHDELWKKVHEVTSGSTKKSKKR
jgi:hypothetical protein